MQIAIQIQSRGLLTTCLRVPTPRAVATYAGPPILTLYSRPGSKDAKKLKSTPAQRTLGFRRKVAPSATSRLDLRDNSGKDTFAFKNAVCP